MKRKQFGDNIGELHADGIAVWYPNGKVRFDGSNCIATPHTTNCARRRKHREHVIEVSIEGGKLSLYKPSPNEEKPPLAPEQMTVGSNRSARDKLARAAEIELKRERRSNMSIDMQVLENQLTEFQFKNYN